MPTQYLTDTPVKGHSATRGYQAPLRQKEGAPPLKGGSIVQTNRRTQAHAPVVWVSSDLAWASTALPDYDGRRCQIELHFSDAKQYWGLADLMNVTPPGVTPAAHLSLFMINGADRLRADRHRHDSAYRVLDLKADCRGSKDVEETRPMLPEKPDPILWAKMRNRVASVGRIHAAHLSFSFS